MNIEYLIQILNNKLTVLNNAKIQAFNSGDLGSMNSLDEEILTTQNTLTQLNVLLNVNTIATSVNTTSAQVVASGIEAVQKQTQGPSASAVINGYDISAYATDIFHEQKIQTIINAMPAFYGAADIDTYIKNIAPDSFVTGDMVTWAASQYSVDIPLMLAIMQNDSKFGTLGVGARTFNPGNVGNTGREERAYATWLDGVLAVAEWLHRHRVVSVAPVEVAPIPTIETPVEVPAITMPTMAPVIPDPIPEETTVVTPEVTIPAPETPLNTEVIPEPKPEASATPATDAPVTDTPISMSKRKSKIA